MTKSHLPAGWSHKRLEDIAITITNGFVGPSAEHYVETGGVSYLMANNVKAQRVDLSRLTHVSQDFHKNNQKSCLQEGDVLTIQTGFIGVSCVVPKNLAGANAHALIITRVDKDLFSPDFICYWLNSPEGNRIINEIKTAGGRPHLNTGDLQKVSIPMPPISEQNMISIILDAWDRAIELTERLIAKKKEFRRGLMERLLTGKLRFKEFGEPARGKRLPTGWKEVAMNEVFERVQRRVAGNGDVEVLSITATVGFVTQKDKFSKVIAGKNLDNYVLLNRGEFAYNKGNSKSYKQGCIYRLSEYDKGVVPNVYYSFKAASDEICPEFYENFFVSGTMNQQLSRVIKTGVRNDGLLNLDADDFFSINIPRPPLAEQVKIAQVLDASSKEIKVLQNKRDALQIQKKGLMQQLLTGKVRVKPPEHAV